MRWRWIIFFGLIVGFVAGGVFWWRSTGIPNDPDEVIVYSLDPSLIKKQQWDQPPKDKEMLYDCPVFGKVSIQDAEQKRAIIDALKADLRSGYASPNKCFWPRHLVRFVKDGKSTDVVVCFECHNYEIHRDGSPHRGLTPSIGESSKPILDQALADAKIPVAP